MFDNLEAIKCAKFLLRIYSEGIYNNNGRMRSNTMRLIGLEN